MKLTWRDAVTTLTMAAVTGIYATYLAGADAWLITTTRGAATAMLILGILGGCSLGRAEELQGDVPPRTAAYRALANAVGLTALITGILAVAVGDSIALAVLYAATAALWALSTARHALVPGGPGTGPYPKSPGAVGARPAHH